MANPRITFSPISQLFIFLCIFAAVRCTNDSTKGNNGGKSDSTHAAHKGIVWPHTRIDSTIPGEYIVSFRLPFAKHLLDSLKHRFYRHPHLERKKEQRESIQKNFLYELAENGQETEITNIFSYGFVFRGDSSVIRKLLRNEKVVRIIPNFYRTTRFPAAIPIALPRQQIPWGVARVSTTIKNNGKYSAAWIIDTGVDTAQPDLNIDIKYCRSFVKSESVYDYIGHGTHVAGIIGAKADNGIGVVGVAPNAPIRALKVIDRSQGIDMANSYIPALEYVKKYGKAGEVLNLSISGFGENDQESRLIQDIAAMGIKVVIAAGNCDRNMDNAPADIGTYIDPVTGKTGIYPANLNGDNIVTVSAFDSSLTFSNCSNFGRSVDVSAPGVDILSTLPGNSWGLRSGTSMAAPHVSGLYLLKSFINSSGQVARDPDNWPDPMAHE